MPAHPTASRPDPVVVAFHRRLQLALALAVVIAIPIGCFGTWTAGRAAAGHPVNLVLPVALGGIGVAATVIAIGQLAVLLGERRHPRVSPLPAAPAHLADHVEIMLTQYAGLSSDQRAQLDGAYRALATGKLHDLAVDRVLRTAEWAGRLHHDGRKTGLRALAACGATPAAYEAVLAVLAADACNPGDLLRLTKAWRAVGLYLPSRAVHSPAAAETVR